MPLYKEECFLVVQPGSEFTIFSFGLQDSLAPPQYKIPSIVYQDPTTKQYKATNDEPNLLEIRPIHLSKIVNLDAFNYLLKVILQSVISKNPIITINQIPLLLIKPSLTWSRSQIEYITKYVIESLEFTAFNVVDISLASTFGVGSTTSSVVVNVGKDYIQVVPVLGYQAIKFSGKYLTGAGGSTINQELQKLLPEFTESQIEDLKVSGIYEVLNTHESSFYSLADLNKTGNDEEQFDVAKLVADGDIAKLEGEEEEEEEKKSNHELGTNFFIDSKTSEKVSVGKERFQGSTTLVKLISDAVYNSLSNIPDSEKRQECYDNLIFIGSTFKIPGLKEAILLKLSQDYLVKEPTNGRSKASDSNGVNSAILAYQQAEEMTDTEGSSNLAQVPNSVKLAKYPEYFPEWKKPKERGGSWEDVSFLGGEIYAKQIFSNNSNHGRELFVDSDVYEESGPQSIWNATI
jgi:Actin and related proteins